MKIKAKKSFVSGRISADPGDVLTVSEPRGRKLISIGAATLVKEKPPKSPEGGQTDTESAVTGNAEGTAAPDGDAARGASTAAK